MTSPAGTTRARAIGRSLRLAAGSWAGWGPRRHLVAAASAVATVVVVAVPTALVPNPVFGREIPPTAWAWPVLLLTAVLSGLLVGTYVRDTPLRRERAAADGASDAPGPGPDADTTRARMGAAGGLLAFFAVGCPVCNKLALLALGYTGALQWFAPVQPWLAAGAIVLLSWALVRRLESDGSCPVPVARPETLVR